MWYAVGFELIPSSDTLFEFCIVLGVYCYKMLQKPWNDKRIRPKLWLLDLQITANLSYRILSQKLLLLRSLLRMTHNTPLRNSLGVLHLLDQDAAWLSTFSNFKTRSTTSRSYEVHRYNASCNIRRTEILPNYHKKCLISGRSRGVRFGFARMPLLAKTKTPHSSMPGQVRW